MSEQTGEKLTTWRNDVKIAALDHIHRHAQTGRTWQPLAGPVQVDITFRFDRPKNHFGTGRNSHLLKPAAPDYPTSRNVGDIEKLIRSTHDAITTAGLWVDDSLVAGVIVWKVYCGTGTRPGARIVIRPAPSASTAVVSANTSVTQRHVEQQEALL